ncbi:hypothetical protein BC940DRAFT_170636 [Gongronella butleri]|nr:hypothetical protein BC940DRAFT_170636 [Gongronella butleri]
MPAFTPILPISSSFLGCEFAVWTLLDRVCVCVHSAVPIGHFILIFTLLHAPFLFFSHLLPIQLLTQSFSIILALVPKGRAPLGALLF